MDLYSPKDRAQWQSCNKIPSGGTQLQSYKAHWVGISDRPLKLTWQALLGGLSSLLGRPQRQAQKFHWAVTSDRSIKPQWEASFAGLWSPAGSPPAPCMPTWQAVWVFTQAWATKIKIRIYDSIVPHIHCLAGTRSMTWIQNLLLVFLATLEGGGASSRLVFAMVIQYP